MQSTYFDERTGRSNGRNDAHDQQNNNPGSSRFDMMPWNAVPNTARSSIPNLEELNASRGMLAMRHPILLDGLRPESPPQDPHNTYLPSYTLESTLPISAEATVQDLAGEAVKTSTHQCSICAKKFTRPFNLRNHVRSHQGERSHTCETCGKAFVRKRDRDEHIRQVHCSRLEKRFICTGCGHRFARKRALNRHHESKAGEGCVRSFPPGSEPPVEEDRSSTIPDQLQGDLPPLARPNRDSPSVQLEAPKGAGQQVSHLPSRSRSSLISADNFTLLTAAELSGWCRPPRVLLVEADPTCGRICAKFLKSFGCVFDVTTGILDAMIKMQGGAQYDIILMDGILLSHVRYTVPMTDRTPVIFMIDNTVSKWQLGMCDVLQKPFTRQSLLGMLQKLLPHFRVSKNDTGLTPDTTNRVQDHGGDALSVPSDDASKARPSSGSEDQPYLADTRGEQDHQVYDWFHMPFPGAPPSPSMGW